MRLRQALSPASVALIGALAFAPAAFAQGAPTSLGEALFGRRPADGRQAQRAPAVARYVSDEGPSFVLQQSGGRALLRFDGSDEVWALRPADGPRGELIWRNDVGRPMLNASRLGGMTVFTPLRPGGAPAALLNGAEPLRPPQITPEQLLERFVAASVRASRAAGHLVRFDGPADIRAGEEPVLAEAANLASSAIVRLASAARPSRVLARIRQVRVARGRGAAATVVTDTVVVTVDPAQGVAGRPSSDRIVLAIVSAR